LTQSIAVADLCKQPPLQMQLVDVRSPSEFASGHIPGAVNIPMDQIESRIPDLCKDVPLVLVCQAGTRARMTADLLADRCSDKEIAVLEGGTDAWIKNGRPLVACVRTRWSLERQARCAAGLIVLAGFLLAIAFNPAWILLSATVGLGLTFAGLTDICPMGILLGKMPWNQKPHCDAVPKLDPAHDH